MRRQLQPVDADGVGGLLRFLGEPTDAPWDLGEIFHGMHHLDKGLPLEF